MFSWKIDHQIIVLLQLYLLLKSEIEILFS